MGVNGGVYARHTRHFGNECWFENKSQLYPWHYDCHINFMNVSQVNCEFSCMKHYQELSKMDVDWVKIWLVQFLTMFHVLKLKIKVLKFRWRFFYHGWWFYSFENKYWFWQYMSIWSSVTKENSMLHLPFSSVRDWFVIYSQFCIYSKEPHNFYNHRQPLIAIVKQFLILSSHAINLPKKCASWIFQCLQWETYIWWAALLTTRGAGKLSSCYWQTSWNLEKKFNISDV